MQKEDMLKIIARHGYNVGFGAKKNFATFDIVCKTSGWISLISLFIGVFALFTPALATNVVSAILIGFGVSTMYIQFYDSEKEKYEKAGIEQTKVFNKLEVIYRDVKSNNNFDPVVTQASIEPLMEDFYKNSISKQITGSNWYAHYKFFCEFEKKWVMDELKLSWRDKIPLSFVFFIFLFLIVSISWLFNFHTIICNI